MRIRWLVPAFTLALLIVWPKCGVTDEASFLRYMHHFSDQGIPYVRGGRDFERPQRGLDCSGAVFVAARMSGARVHYMPSADMQRGRGGWGNGIDLGAGPDGLQLAQPGDLLWWTFDDPHGHTGVVTRDRNGWPGVAHASTSRHRMVVDAIQGTLHTRVSWVRRPRIWTER